MSSTFPPDAYGHRISSERLERDTETHTVALAVGVKVKRTEVLSEHVTPSRCCYCHAMIGSPALTLECPRAPVEQRVAATRQAINLEVMQELEAQELVVYVPASGAAGYRERAACNGPKVGGGKERNVLPSAPRPMIVHRRIVIFSKPLKVHSQPKRQVAPSGAAKPAYMPYKPTAAIEQGLDMANAWLHSKGAR